MPQLIYTFKGKWKEELICSCALGEFRLEFPMGNPSVYFQIMREWIKIAPDWAKNDWQNLHTQLQAWCVHGGFPLDLDDEAIVFLKYHYCATKQYALQPAWILAFTASKRILTKLKLFSIFYTSASSHSYRTWD